MRAERIRARVVGVVAIIATIVVFIIPFLFVVDQAAKTPADAASLAFSWPTKWQFFENLVGVVQYNGGVIFQAFINSAVLTVFSVLITTVFAAMVGYVLQRKPSRWNPVINFFVLAGLIVPPAVVPTIWVLQDLGIFQTMLGMILVEATFGLSFNILLFRAFVATIPKELDEAAVLDGSGPIRMFFSVILPLLRPVLATVIVVQAVVVFNDFAGPLYFLPGQPTVQLTLYQFQGQALSFNNLLFMDILLITIPPLVLYVFFNRQIVAGMTSGAVKG